MRVLLLAASAAALCGCSTFSFGPPHVDQHQKMTNASLGRDCALTPGEGAELPENMEGARTLIRNYFDAYECAMRVAANGRQVFELPAFLSLVGSTTAVALGAGHTVAIAGGAGNSVFTAGKGYYAPQVQTAILGDALDAINCIRSEAVGINPTVIEAVSEQQEQRPFLRENARRGGVVQVTAEVQYFDMVSAKLGDVHGIATSRLAGRGSINAANIAAEIETLVNKIREAKEAKDKPPPPAPGMVEAFGRGPAQLLAMSQYVQLQLDELEPELAKCVVRAKS